MMFSSVHGLGMVCEFKFFQSKMRPKVPLTCYCGLLVFGDDEVSKDSL